jgi:hypothetical protein
MSENCCPTTACYHCHHIYPVACPDHAASILKQYIMTRIRNLDGLSAQDINRELVNGAKFVVFQYCISILVMTFRRGSDIYFVRSDESAGKHGLKFSLLTLFLGWWGIPWGPIYSIGSLYTNLRGGKDVTEEVLQSLNSANP